MANYRTKNKLLLAKVEATSGQDASPTVGTDAVLAEEPQQDPEFEVIQTNEIGASLDSRGPIVGGGFMGMTLTPLLKGAGAAGQAPEIGPLLRGCAMSETLTAADVTGTAQGGTANTVRLAVGGVTSNDQYKGTWDSDSAGSPM